MPKVEMNYQDEYKDYRRMELGFACIEEHESMTNQIFGLISGLSSFPWQNQTFLGHGHTLPISGIEGYNYILFLLLNCVLYSKIDITKILLN